MDDLRGKPTIFGNIHIHFFEAPQLPPRYKSSFASPAISQDTSVEPWYGEEEMCGQETPCIKDLNLFGQFLVKYR